ncbi:MAG: hypothetical protein FWD30_04200 [Dehalococcoidia bacterium]|nr:hypothetical protein [Dehalococcoidia bacterium]
MRNLRIAMILYGAIQIAEGFVMWLMPDKFPSFIGFNEQMFMSTDARGFLNFMLILAGVAFIAGGFIIIAGSFNNPWRNANPVRFAILWSALMFVGQIHALIKGSVSFGQIWFVLIITAIFLAAFLIFYPWPFNRKSFR